MTRLLPLLITVLGASAVVAGVSMISIAAGLIVAGVLVALAGMFLIDDGRE